MSPIRLLKNEKDLRGLWQKLWCSTMHCLFLDMIDHHSNRSGGRIVAPVCDRVMIRRGGGELSPFSGSCSPSCCGCSTSGPRGFNVFMTRLGMTLSWCRLRRALPLWVSTMYDRGASAFSNTTPGVGLLLSVVIQTSACWGIWGSGPCDACQNWPFVET